MGPPGKPVVGQFDASPSYGVPTVDRRNHDGGSRPARSDPRTGAPGRLAGSLGGVARGVAATTAARTGAASAGRPAPRTAAASVRVAPVVTTSSTRTSRAP